MGDTVVTEGSAGTLKTQYSVPVSLHFVLRCDAQGSMVVVGGDIRTSGSWWEQCNDQHLQELNESSEKYLLVSL